MRLSATLPAQCWWYARTSAPRPTSGLPTCKGVDEKASIGTSGVSTLSWVSEIRGFGVPARRRGGGRVDERRGTTEAQDVYGTSVRLTRDGLAYGEQFVVFDEMDDARPASDSLWNPATNLFEVAVFRRQSPQLVVKNLPPRTADLLRKAMTDALRERRS